MREIRSDSLKFIAIICMFIDHIGAGILERYMMHIVDPARYEVFLQVYDVTRAVGRLAMPIFCYQIMVGMFYTSSRARYLRNLFIFALVSEVPYDLLFQGNFVGSRYVGKLVDFGDQNVMFTLFLGAFVIYSYEELKMKMWPDGENPETPDAVNRILKSILFLAITGVASAIAELINSDYGAKGVLLIAILYVFRYEREKMTVYGVILFLMELVLITFIRTHNWMLVKNYMMTEAYACLAFPFMLADNGRRRKSKLLKWCGYAFYPAHMLLIYGINLLMFK